MSLLVFKAALRSNEELAGPDRQSVIEQRVHHGAILPSLVAIATLTTVLALRHPDNVDLRAKVVEAWRDLDKGTKIGGIIWDGWTRQALGILQ